MDNRTNRYSEDSGTMSRVAKNNELYKKINEEELSNYTIRSNATVLGNQEPEIDIEKIKKILDTRYNSAPQRKSIRIEPKEEVNVTYDDTKEYDINAVIEKAKIDKIDDYEEQRMKKLRDTQYDILNNLKLDQDDNTEYSEKKQEELMELINTITINEKKKLDKIKESEDENLDLLDDLKGSDDTQVYGSMSEELEELKNTTLEQPIKEFDKVKAEEKVNETKENSFYTTDIFNKRDFVEDEKLFDDSKYNIWIKILVALVIIAFLVALFLFLKSFLNF